MVTNKRFYTGIGSRDIPTDIGITMRSLAIVLARNGFILRSGGAAGADSAFEEGCDVEGGGKEIYLPWERFRNNSSTLHYISPEAIELAEDYYGQNWLYTKTTTKKFMARNMYQVTGQDLNAPSEFIICWTPDGCTSMSKRSRVTGGTGQAIAYGSDLEIPVFNLKNENAYNEIVEHFYNIGIS